MKKNTAYFLTLCALISLAAFSCGAKKKGSDGTDRTGQGQHDGNPGDPRDPNLVERLRVYCNNKKGLYIPGPDYVCQFPVTVALPKDEDLKKITEPTLFPLLKLPEPPLASPAYLQLRARIGDGYAFLWNSTTSRTLLPLGKELSDWITLGDGAYGIMVYPGTTDIRVYAQSCVDINLHYVTCRF